MVGVNDLCTSVQSLSISGSDIAFLRQKGMRCHVEECLLPSAS
jgi:hypothetical protein